MHPGDEQMYIDVRRLPGTVHVKRGFQQAQESQAVHKINSEHDENQPQQAARSIKVRSLVVHETSLGKPGQFVVAAYFIQPGMLHEGHDAHAQGSGDQDEQRLLAEGLKSPLAGKGIGSKICYRSDRCRGRAAQAYRDKINHHRKHDRHAHPQGQRYACQPGNEAGFIAHERAEPCKHSLCQHHAERKTQSQRTTQYTDK